MPSLRLSFPRIRLSQGFARRWFAGEMLSGNTGWETEAGEGGTTVPPHP